MQAAAELQRQLRQQDFELHSPNPRMLPAEYCPRKLRAEVVVESPALAEQPEPKGKRKAARAGQAKGRKTKGAGSLWSCLSHIRDEGTSVRQGLSCMECAC